MSEDYKAGFIIMALASAIIGTMMLIIVASDEKTEIRDGDCKVVSHENNKVFGEDTERVERWCKQ